MESITGISIVIATKGRVELLEALLESVKRARNNYRKESEVILVDDSSESDQKRIDELCEKWDARREYFSPSVAGKRNYGAELARYEIVLFLDSDCIATPNILEEHERMYVDGKVGGVAGPLEFTGDENWYWQSVRTSPYVLCFQMPRWGDTSVWAATANFSVRKKVFIQLNGFDESFPNKPGGEDVDFGLRLTKNGYKILNTQKGLVYHDKKTWMDMQAMRNRCWNYGRADVYLVEKHPDYSTYTPPRKILLWLIGFVTCVLLTVFLSWKVWFLIPAWIIVDINVETVLALRFNYGDNDFLHQMMTQQLGHINELGYIWECISRKDLSYMFKQTVFFEEQMKSIPYNGMIRGWQFIVQYVMFVVAALFLATVL